MPVLAFPLRRLQARLSKPVAPERLRETIPRLGVALEASEGDTWTVECFPNRPDLLSVEGLARALRAYLGIEPGLRGYQVADGDAVLTVDPSVRPVRPAIACGIVRGVPFDEEVLAEVIGLQEDLHWGPGARRRKVSIGVHDMRAIEPPFTYKAVDPSRCRFVPLHHTTEMSMREIVEKHETGVAYRHLVDGADRWPVIVDAKGQVLSFPPIINGTVTALHAGTRDVFLDVTGTDERGCLGVLSLLAAHFAEMGGRLEAVTVKTGRRRLRTPDLSPGVRRLRPDAANRLLGTGLSPQQMAEALGRMGMDAAPARGGLEVRVPAYRLDVLHEVDLIEDVAVGHGYGAIPDRLPADVVFGAEMPTEVLAQRVRRVMTGFGYLECMTLTLVGAALEAEATRAGATAPAQIRVQNPVSVDHDRLRATLIPSLLDIARHNVHRDLPQAFFEVGDVIVAPAGDGDRRPRNERRVAAVLVASDASFTAIKRVADGLQRELRMVPRERVDTHPAMQEGRTAAVLSPDGAVLGHYGEVAPDVIVAFGLANPVVAFEMVLEGGRADEVRSPHAGSAGK